MKKLIIKNGTLVMPDKTETGMNIVCENGKITDVTPNDITDENAEVYDAAGKYVLPGFVDIHLHGGGGYDFMDGTEEAFVEIARTHFEHGTTSIVPTTVSCGKEELFNLFDVYRKCAKNSKTADLIGIHMEGPFISHEMKGAQRDDCIITPTEEFLDELFEKAGDIISKITAAPEIDGSDILVEKAKKHNIMFAIGHSNATCEQVLEAYKLGFNHITHLYSNTPSIRKINQVVHAGIVEAAYLLDGMSIELIGDGKHVPAEVIKMAHKIKGGEKMVLVSDAMRAAGTDVSESYLGSVCPENRVIIEDGVAKLPDRSFFAGSIGTGDGMFKNAVTNAGLSVSEASEIMSLTPAKLIGYDKTKGSIEKGKDADIVIMNKEFEIDRVIGKNLFD